MLNEAVLLALNTQMNNEFKNFMTYKSLSGIADYQSLNGAVKFLNSQAMDEYSHFNKFYDYIVDKGHIPHITAQAEIPPQLLTIDAIFSLILDLENNTLTNLQLVSQVCKETQDDQSFGLLQELLSEQTSEVKEADDHYKRCLMSLNNILIFDNELGSL